MSTDDLIEALGCRFDALQRRKLAPVDVAILDSGIDATHADLAGSEISTFRVEAGEGAPSVIKIPERINNDTYGHGTAVASIIARIAPNARFIDLRVLDPKNAGTGDALIAALDMVLTNKWRVINMSLAASAAVGRRLSPYCERAYYQNQIIVAAQRNFPIEDNGFPAEFSSSIGVDFEAFKAPFELHYRGGRPIEYIAPGDQVTVAAPGGGYTVMTGTSFATPAVAGLCALLLGAYRGLHPFELKTVLKAHASRVSEPRSPRAKEKSGPHRSGKTKSRKTGRK
jgi:subtilisin